MPYVSSQHRHAALHCCTAHGLLRRLMSSCGVVRYQPPLSTVFLALLAAQAGPLTALGSGVSSWAPSPQAGLTP